MTVKQERKVSQALGLVLDRAGIETFHRKITAEIKKRLHWESILETQESGNWGRAHKGRSVVFQLIVTNPPDILSRAQRKQDAACPVFRVYCASAYDLGAWAGWHEEWESLGDGRFQFVGASWSFYWGPDHRVDKDQLLRGEYDSVPKRGGDAAQPHWHFDPTISYLLPASENESSVSDRELRALEALPASALIRLPSATVGAEAIRTHACLSLAGIHLGMGGWEHSFAGYGEWQRPVDTDVLLKWSISTLTYTIGQLHHLKFEFAAE